MKLQRQMMQKARRMLGGALVLLALGARTPASAQEGAATETWAFNYPGDSFRADAQLDLRSLNEKVAGESGFVRLSADGNSFVLGNGKPVRFWAVVSDIYRQSPDEMARHARFLAKLGVNMVRLHTQIAPIDKNARITDVNEKEIDGIWHCVAALKREGIYVTISPYWANDKEASSWGLDGYGHDGLWGLLFFNEKLQQGYKAWVKALYARKNPYTGIPLAEDPSVALIQVQNEDSLFFWTTQAIKPEQQALLAQKYARWLVKKYGSLESAKQAWEGAGSDKDDLAQGKVALLNVWPMTQNWDGGMAKRVNDECEFYAETQRQFYASIADYYHKELGCKQLVNASNWITADPVKLNDIERWTYTATDVLAVNKYTGGVHTGDNNGWRIDPGHHFTNQSCLLDPRGLPTNLKQVVGHPMVITESSWVNPEGFQSEGPFLMAAYQSLTGVDTFYWFAAGETPAYNPNPYLTFLNLNGQHPLNKWTCATPMLMGQFPATALMYRLNYIRQGDPVVHEERPLADLWQRKTPRIAEDRTFDPNRNTGNSRGTSDVQKGVDPLAFLVGPVDVKYGGDPKEDKVADLTQYIDHDKHIVKSVTGEVTLDYGLGLCTINAPKAQGVSGFLKKAGTVALHDVTIQSGNGYASVSVVAMDDKPLYLSHRILVQVGTYARPTGWQTRAADFKSDDGKQTFQGYEIVNTGSAPWRIANADITLTIHNAHLTKATLLDSAGYAAQTVPLTSVTGGKVACKLPPNTLYLILE